MEKTDEKVSILIVDDDENVCKSLALILRKKGYAVETAGTGHEALEKAREGFFNVALLDIKLPDMEGIELIGPLKELHPDIDMFMITAYASMETAVTALNKGATAYFLKPPDMAEVLVSVKDALEKQRLVKENRMLLKTVQKELAERKQAEEALIKTRDELDLRVIERTNELAEVNVKLQDDITERKRAEEALRTERDKLKQIFEAMDDGVYIVNQDYDIEYVNPVLIADFGPYEGRKCYAYFHDREEVCPWCKNQDVFAGNTVRWEWYSFKNGKTYDLIDTPIRNADGTISKLEIFRDITDRKRLETEMLRSAKLGSLGIMAGGLAHDFNNFLASIMLNVSTARLKARKDEEIRDLLQAAEQSIQQARGITQQLLTFTRGGEPVKSSRSLQPIIKESVKFTLHGSKTMPRFYLPDDLWPVEVDPSQINQVINSLAINAVQAMPRGGYLTVTGRNVIIEEGDDRTALQPGNYMEVAVKDEGVGIPPESIDSVFDPYYTTREGGTGLGLFSVHSIIERHGGWITVESEVDRGTTFTFYLPAAAEVVEVPSSGVIQKGSGRVLVMDDNDMIRLGFTALLGELGYEVETTADGEEAIERYAEALQSDRPFDAVILDLTVPGHMGGAEAIERLKELDPRVRAVVSSGYSTDPILANYREYGFKAVLPKPFQPADLSRAMETVLG